MELMMNRLFEERFSSNMMDSVSLFYWIYVTLIYKVSSDLKVLNFAIIEFVLINIFQKPTSDLMICKGKQNKKREIGATAQARATDRGRLV